MKAYRFGLAAVAQVRRGQALQARQEVARILRQMERAFADEACRAQLYQGFLESEQPVPGHAFMARFEQGERLAATVAGAARRRHELEGQLSQARQAALQAERNLALLEKLDQRRRHEWVLAAQREDAAILDEFATVRAATRPKGAA